MRKDFEAWVRRIAPAGGDINWDGQPIKVSWATWQAATTAAQQPAAVVELTGEELHEAWSGADGVPSGFDEYALRAVIAAHVAKQGGES